MSVLRVAKRTFGQAVQLERRTTGLTDRVPSQWRRQVRQLLGMGPLQEARRYAPADGLEQLFEKLKRQNTRYVVLRWFESLPARAEGDIDILVADDELPQLETLLTAGRDGVPCDLYSESGLAGSRYAGMSYFPPQLAQRILARRTIAPGSVSVPCAEDHFVSLAYHAVYHKGLQSGLRTSMPVVHRAVSPNHSYGGTLNALAEKLGLSVQISLEALDEFLFREGWRPPPKLIKRLAPHNPWLRHRFDRNGERLPSGSVSA